MLPNFQKLDDQDLCNQCHNLWRTLRSGDESDVDGKELVVEVMCDDMTADKKTFGVTVPQSVGHLPPASECGISREELLKAEVHQDLLNVFHGTGSPHWSCNNQHQP